MDFRGLWINSVIMLYLIPNKGFLNQSKNNEKEINQSHIASQDIYTAAKEHRLDNTEGVYTNEKWEFNFDEKQLEIVFLDMENSNIQILAERKTTNDNKIEAIEYLTKSIFYGIDYTDKIKPPKIYLVGKELKITKPEGYSVKITSFMKEFTLPQFSEKRKKQQEYFSNMMWGQRIVYLRIPKDLEIVDNKLNVQFIDEE
jgi:hypothetical protein